MVCFASAVGGAGSVATASALADSDSAQAVEIDPTRPETWQGAVERVRREKDTLVNALVALAKDDKSDTAARQKAVLHLADLRTARALDFLIGNVSLGMQGGIRVSAEDQAKAFPCKYVLSEYRPWGVGMDSQGFPPRKRTDWGSAQAILLRVRGRPAESTDLMYLASALEIILGRDLAVSAVDHTLRLADQNEPAWRDNLAALKALLQPK